MPEESMRVVCIEDEPEMIDLVRLILGRRGFEVLGANGGIEGLETVKRETPDLILLDLMMPKLNGIDLLEQIRKFDKDLAVIIFTGYPSIETAIKSLKLRVADYIKKPFDIDEFNQTIEKILRERPPVTARDLARFLELLYDRREREGESAADGAEDGAEDGQQGDGFSLDVLLKRFGID